MVSEVENILVEIREHVRAEEEAKRAASGDRATLEQPAASPGGLTSPESLAHLSAHLTTTARAWDRLPPVMSNRTGMTARIELWIKRRLKKLGHWFTWEQVNFNSAVHHALVETEQTLSRQAQELAGLRAALAGESETRGNELAQKEKEIQTLRSAIDEQARKQATQYAQSQAAEQEARSAVEARLSSLAGELRERDEQLSAEQRVCFKQLSLETSEAAVLEDRGRRAIEARVRKLEETRDSARDKAADARG